MYLSISVVITLAFNQYALHKSFAHRRTVPFPHQTFLEKISPFRSQAELFRLQTKKFRSHQNPLVLDKMFLPTDLSSSLIICTPIVDRHGTRSGWNMLMKQHKICVAEFFPRLWLTGLFTNIILNFMFGLHTLKCLLPFLFMDIRLTHFCGIVG